MGDGRSGEDTTTRRETAFQSRQSPAAVAKGSLNALLWKFVSPQCTPLCSTAPIITVDPEGQRRVGETTGWTPREARREKRHGNAQKARCCASFALATPKWISTAEVHSTAMSMRWQPTLKYNLAPAAVTVSHVASHNWIARPLAVSV